MPGGQRVTFDEDKMPDHIIAHGVKVELWPLPDFHSFPPIREQDVTSSVISCLSVGSRFKSRWQYWMEKAGRLPEPKEKRHMYRGRLYEEAIATEAQREWADLSVIHKNENYYRDPAIRLGATPDYFASNKVARPFPLEVKMVGFDAWRDHWAEGVDAPLDYQLQLQCQMGLTGADKGVIVALVQGRDLVRFDYDFRPETYKVIRAQTIGFWASIRDGIEPPIDLEGIKPEYIIKAYAKAREGKIIDLTADNAINALCADLLKAETAAKALRDELSPFEKQIKQMKAAILAKMGDAQGADTTEYEINTKTRERSGYTVDATAWREIGIERKKPQ